LRRLWPPLSLIATCVLCFSASASGSALFVYRYPPAADVTSPRDAKVGKIMTDDDLFEHVPFDTNKQSACSPADPGIEWRGLKVRVPSEVALPKKNTPHFALVIPLCGIYRINLAQAIRFPGPLTLIVTDIATGKTYRGPIVDRDPNITIPPPPSPPLNASAFEGVFSSTYFNVDVASYVALPLQPSRYRLKVEWAGYQSNEVTIAVVHHP